MSKTLPLTARQPRPYTPPAIEKRHMAELDAWEAGGKKGKAPVKPIIMVAVPTSLERDTISSLLFELGVVQVTRETVRNIILEECFSLYGDEKGEELALFLEGFWVQQELFEDKVAFWQEQERQRLLDEFHGGKKRDPIPMPEHDSSVRDRMRAKREVDTIIEKSQLVRRKLGEQTSYSQVNGTMLVRLHCRGWQGFETQREAIAPAADGSGFPPAEILTEECTALFREELGHEAWQQLVVEIDGQYGLKAAEVGNSDSPPENGSKSDGSTAGGEESDAGASLGTNAATK